MKYIIKNGRIILPDEILDNASLLISDGKIEKIIPNGQQITGDYEEIDAKGMYIPTKVKNPHVIVCLSFKRESPNIYDYRGNNW